MRVTFVPAFSSHDTFDALLTFLGSVIQHFVPAGLAQDLHMQETGKIHSLNITINAILTRINDSTKPKFRYRSFLFYKYFKTSMENPTSP